MTDQHSIPATNRDLRALMAQFPLLQRSHDRIRETRSPAYLENGDRFAWLWAEPLQVAVGAEQVAGTDMVVLDTLFERASSTDELNRIYVDLKAMSDPASAAALLRDETDDPDEHLDLETAAKLHLAFLTDEGIKRLKTSREGESLAEAWLSVWRHKLDVQNLQQVSHSIASLEPESYRPGAVASFADGVDTYLRKYGEMGALSVAVVGVFPFSRLADRDLLDGLLPLLDIMVPLIRLAQDVRFDPEEVLNAGIYALAAERDANLAEACRLITSEEVPASELERQLRERWSDYYARAQDASSSVLRDIEGSATRQALAGFNTALLTLAEQLTRPWKT